MKMKQLPLLPCLLVVALTCTACKRDAEPVVPASTPAADATTGDATSAATGDMPEQPATPDVTGFVDMASPASADADFDVRAFAGTFAAPGAFLEIDADGGYRMTVRAESADADLVSAGTWTLEPDGEHILLDPESKSDPDRRYALASNDELRPDDGGPSLQRQGE